MAVDGFALEEIGSDISQMRPLGLFFRLSYNVKPDPEHELFVLENTAAEFGQALLLLTRDVSSLSPGALIALGADGLQNGYVLATGRFVEFIDVLTEQGQVLLREHGLYRAQRPENAAGFVVLNEVELQPNGTVLDRFDAWSAAGKRLSAASLPENSDGVSIYFVTGAAPPSDEETGALVAAKSNEDRSRTQRRGRPVQPASAGADPRDIQEIEMIAAEQYRTDKPPGGRRLIQARQLTSLLQQLVPRIRLVGQSAAASLDFDEAQMKALGTILQMLQVGGAPSETSQYVKPLPNQRGWLECRIGNTTGRLYFKPVGSGHDILVLVSNKARQLFDIPRLTSYG